MFAVGAEKRIIKLLFLQCKIFIKRLRGKCLLSLSLSSSSSKNHYEIIPLYQKCWNAELFLFCIFLHSSWLLRFSEQISIFSPNEGKSGPKKLRLDQLSHSAGDSWFKWIFWVIGFWKYTWLSLFTCIFLTFMTTSTSDGK